MQILEIVLYGRAAGQKRVLPLRAGEVNIITGQSHTGKSALIQIVSFCLGGQTCHVPTGRILDAVSWFGLLLQSGTERIFVARPNPFPQHSSTTEAFILRGATASPGEAPAAANISVEAFEETLTRIIGINPNRSTPPAGQTRPPLAANIRHALFYCFQHQTEIASNQSLFHKQQGQASDFIMLAVRDTLPYFLGAIQENELALEEQLALAKRQLRQLESEQRQNQQIQGEGISKAVGLVEEAIAVGILPSVPIPTEMSELRNLMVQAAAWTAGETGFIGADQLSQLQGEYDILKEERSRLLEALRAARTMAGETQGFSDEATIQGERLESIGLFEEVGDAADSCPVCSHELETPTPTAAAIRNALNQLAQSLASAERERPQLRDYIERTNQQLATTGERIAEKEAAIQALLNQQESAQRIRDLNARRAKVVGRISLYMESISPDVGTTELQQRLEQARARVEQLSSMVDPEEKQRRLTLILNRLSTKMSEYSRALRLEWAECPVWLDISAATVIIDKPERPEPLNRIGSGDSWIGYHLVVHLALHRHFRQNHRPVPAFLFLDQPTQVYFPPDLDSATEGDVDALERDDDRQKVRRMFDLIFEAVAELNPNFQIVVTDHADIRSSEQFQRAIVERWRGEGNALIPADW